MSTKVDLQQIADNLGFGLSDVEMLINMFIDASNDSIEQLFIAIQENNYDDMIAHAHAVKGSAANIMLEDITAIAQEIELGAHNKESNIDYHSKCEELKQLVNNIL